MQALPKVPGSLLNSVKHRDNTSATSFSPCGNGLCPDWVLSNNSNVSVAVDLAYFTSYTPFVTHIVNNAVSSNTMHVSGIGTVELRVLKHKVNKGKQSQRTITLHNVLHAPGLLCNILGYPFLEESEGTLNFEDYSLKRRDGSIVAQLELRPKQAPQLDGSPESSGLPCLKLCRSPERAFAESKLEPGAAYFISVTWPQAERQRYVDHCSAGVIAALETSAATTASVQPYTPGEKEWLRNKSGHGDEYHFLQAHGLSIYKDKDREEGRELVRALMEDDELPEVDEDEEDEEDDEWDPTGHQADYAFSHDELEFIEKHYGNSEHFLIIHGLKFYDNEDLEEGKAIVKAFMTEDEEK